ncbi:hypothetical protein CKAH01_08217 [Colletotrichum kahawae]|uniref:Uncharacterized protein n=1 Tax=Colletotrichum kahawae TaxID=34407 RepID=A0AAD9Y1T6_COLKA|nr:hypothetical protein CKAH01_08217 [Colletotrichum kahawae]
MDESSTLEGKGDGRADPPRKAYQDRPGSFFFSPFAQGTSIIRAKDNRSQGRSLCGKRSCCRDHHDCRPAVPLGKPNLGRLQRLRRVLGRPRVPRSLLINLINLSPPEQHHQWVFFQKQGAWENSQPWVANQRRPH